MTHCYIAYHHNAGADDEHVVVKIGFSANPASRFRELCAMSWICPKWIEATTRNTSAKGSDIERFMHEYLRVHRIHHEWFHVPRTALQDAKRAVWDRFGEAFVLEDVSDEDGLENVA